MKSGENGSIGGSGVAAAWRRRHRGVQNQQWRRK